ncbi:MAG TPA: hybrid sensor histidine kinase/response regulator [Anaerolineae bacterium]|nr:hybrid sensor histidine kinase/response regulator [Anaerolineae bacterium]
MSKMGLVLVVDDEKFNRILLSTHLREVGYDVLEATDGKEALVLLEKEQVDAVLLDLIMPDMDGYEVLRQMQAEPHLRLIPVIIISNLKDADTLAQCIELGATDHLPKPFKATILKARLDKSLAQKRLREAEIAHTQQLEEQNQELDAFAGTVAHDLKTPLVGIVGFSSFLVQNYDQLSREQRLKMAENILSSGEKMSNIIEELLLLARIRKDDVRLTEIDMEAILGEVKARLQYMFDEYQPQMSMPDSWPRVLGYGSWVEEVWVNYITNALKYGGKPPEVQLGYTKTADGMIRFFVVDNGSGLSSEEQKDLFAPFTRLSQVRIEGHGLGLSIVQRIVTKLGGEVGVESEVGQGSTFWFSLLAVDDNDGA